MILWCLTIVINWSYVKGNSNLYDKKKMLRRGHAYIYNKFKPIICSKRLPQHSRNMLSIGNASILIKCSMVLHMNQDKSTYRNVHKIEFKRKNPTVNNK